MLYGTIKEMDIDAQVKSLQKVNLDGISRAGKKIYKRIRSRYEPKYNGQFLAINPKTKKEYLGKTTFNAVQKAKKDDPDTVLYLVKIGYETTESLNHTSWEEIEKILR